MQPLNILIIEDNITIAGQLTEFFEGHGWEVDYANSGKQGLELALERVFDVVVLDLNLPDIDGLKVCKAIKQRAEVNLPVLMLTARDAFEDKAIGFGEGADDYITKPFEFRELALRCQALARRRQLHQKQVITIGELVLDLREHKASRCDTPLKLTSIGFNLLVLLAQAYPQPVSRSRVIHHIWGDEPPDSDALRSHIYSLRVALDKPFSKPMLTTITNVGFQLVSSDDEK